MEKDDTSVSETTTEIVNTWNDSQETLLKAISERSNCMRWLHTQCQTHFEYMNFYLTIPNVVISTLNGSFTMSLTALFPSPEAQKYATTIIGLISIFSAILITMNQYVKSQQMMEAHRAAALAYGKLHRMISNELSMKRCQRSNGFEFLKIVRSEQDRLESMSPTIIPNIIRKFNIIFANREIEKPEIAGDLDQVNINNENFDGNRSMILKSRKGGGSPVAKSTRLYDLASGSLISSKSQSRIVPSTIEEALFPTDKPDDQAVSITLRPPPA